MWFSQSRKICPVMMLQLYEDLSWHRGTRSIGKKQKELRDPESNIEGVHLVATISHKEKRHSACTSNLFWVDSGLQTLEPEHSATLDTVNLLWDSKSYFPSTTLSFQSSNHLEQALWMTFYHLETSLVKLFSRTWCAFLSSIELLSLHLVSLLILEMFPPCDRCASALP